MSELSGGNQQKVVIGRWLATTAAVLLLDDPTKGIDIQTKEDLYATLDELCAQGVSILLHSSDDEELLAVADRVLVFNGGRIVAELSGEQRNRFACIVPLTPRARRCRRLSTTSAPCVARTVHSSAIPICWRSWSFWCCA